MEELLVSFSHYKTTWYFKGFCQGNAWFKVPLMQLQIIPFVSAGGKGMQRRERRSCLLDVPHIQPGRGLRRSGFHADTLAPSISCETHTGAGSQRGTEDAESRLRYTRDPQALVSQACKGICVNPPSTEAAV